MLRCTSLRGEPKGFDVAIRVLIRRPSHPASRQRHDEGGVLAEAALGRAVQGVIADRRHRLEVALAKLSLLNPAQILAKGYSLTQVRGKPLSSVKGLNLGDDVTVSLTDGEFQAQVAAIRPKEVV